MNRTDVLNHLRQRASTLIQQGQRLVEPVVVRVGNAIEAKHQADDERMVETLLRRGEGLNLRRLNPEAKREDKALLAQCDQQLVQRVRERIEAEKKPIEMEVRADDGGLVFYALSLRRVEGKKKK